MSNKFAQSSQGKRLAKEIDDAIRVLDNNFHPIDNGFELDNDGINDIIDEFADLQGEYAKMNVNGWASDLGHSWRNATHEEHFQHGLRTFKNYTSQHSEIGNDVRNLTHTIRHYLNVTDLPPHHQ